MDKFMRQNIDQIDNIRDHSRRLVRELGFMNRSLAGTDMSPSAVHAILEIGYREDISARDLCKILLLEKSTVSRLLASLRQRHIIAEKKLPGDGREKRLGLTRTGALIFSDIENFGRRQVANALRSVDADAAGKIEAGLQAYASALHASRDGNGRPGEDWNRAAIRPGYIPGLLGRMVELHGAYYSREVSFGLEFEVLVGRELAEFFTRLDHPGNATWYVLHNRRIAGGISIAGETLEPGIAQLRWFILDDAVRGAGLGSKLMDAAMAFVRQQDFTQVYLWTFAGLDAARGLYEKHGFELAEEKTGRKWGPEVLEQKFVLSR
jgi:DNA-binding MarR family transcriptional regulator/N-acetylglutamate synthase-like GNAT family acetyltransferase